MGRVVLYSPEGESLREVLALQEQAQAAGVAVTEYVAGGSWSELLERLEPGDELVLSSLSCFTSLNELLGFMATRDVRIHSLREAWFSAPIEEPLDYLRCLYELSSSLHAARTRKGLAEAALEGRRPGRRLGAIQPTRPVNHHVVLQVDTLRKEHRLSVVDACARVGVSVNVYYRMRKKA